VLAAVLLWAVVGRVPLDGCPEQAATTGMVVKRTSSRRSVAGTSDRRSGGLERCQHGERLIPLPSWAVEVLRRRRGVIGADVEAVFPDSVGGWRAPSNVRRVWRAVRDGAELEAMVSHTLCRSGALTAGSRPPPGSSL
jgi:hypothetical protein